MPKGWCTAWLRWWPSSAQARRAGGLWVAQRPCRLPPTSSRPVATTRSALPAREPGAADALKINLGLEAPRALPAGEVVLATIDPPNAGRLPQRPFAELSQTVIHGCLTESRPSLLILEKQRPHFVLCRRSILWRERFKIARRKSIGLAAETIWCDSEKRDQCEHRTSQSGPRRSTLAGHPPMKRST